MIPGDPEDRAPLQAASRLGSALLGREACAIERVKQPPHPWHSDNACHPCAVANQLSTYKDLGLTLVAGSLGIGLVTEGVFYEYGDPARRTVGEFLASPFSVRESDGCWRLDAHVWLEDAGGRIYDVVSSTVVFAAGLHGKTLLYKSGDVLLAACPAATALEGLHYVAAPKDAGKFLLDILERNFLRRNGATAREKFSLWSREGRLLEELELPYGSDGGAEEKGGASSLGAAPLHEDDGGAPRGEGGCPMSPRSP